MTSKYEEEYLAGSTIQELANRVGCSFTKIRNDLLRNGVELRRLGQQYPLPEKEKFIYDCERMRWYDLEKEYGVSWSIIKYWKKRYGLTNGKKGLRLVDTRTMSNGCMLCVSHKSSKGYPRGKGGRLIAIRNWEEKNNLEWPKGKLTRHLCANPWCVSPEHAVPGDFFENKLDEVLDGRTTNTVLTRAYERGLISFNKEGKVVRSVDGKVFDITGRIEMELKVICDGKFKRLSDVETNDDMIEGGDPLVAKVDSPNGFREC